MALLALLVVTLGAWSVSGRLLAPVRQLRTTAQEITDTDLSRRIPVEGHDDISDLVRTVNAMLDRLDGAFATQRTFLDDAGHELRTPVTVLRGHLELLDPYDHQDVTTTRELLLDEIDRMSRLVDDLIVLAKAGRPDFLRPAPTDVGVLTDQVLDKARATPPAAGSWTSARTASLGSMANGSRRRSCSSPPTPTAHRARRRGRGRLPYRRRPPGPVGARHRTGGGGRRQRAHLRAFPPGQRPARRRGLRPRLVDRPRDRRGARWQRTRGVPARSALRRS